MNEIEDYRKKIEGLTEKLRQYSAKTEYCFLDDNFLLEYSKAVLNILGEFTNGHCPFSYETESYSPDFIYPEYDLKCKLDDCC